MGTMTEAIRLPIRIRFVGGCWHNMLPELQFLPEMYSTADGVHTYHLAEFYTRIGTPYYQYIHESFIRGSVVSLSTCRERVPYWEAPLEKLHALSKKPRQAFKQN